MPMTTVGNIVSTRVLEARNDGTDETAALQAAFAANGGPGLGYSKVTLRGAFRCNGAGVRLDGRFVVDAHEASFNVSPESIIARARLFYTMPNACVIWSGGRFTAPGSPFPAGVEWRIGWYVDSCAEMSLSWATFVGFTDGVYVGGNVASDDVTLVGLAISGSRRSGISIVHAARVEVVRCEIFDGAVGATPGSGIEVEPNTGTSIGDVAILRCDIARHEVGVYVQPGRGLPGDNMRILDCRIDGNRRYGLVVNAADGVVVAGNEITESPIGISIGGHTDDARARRVVVADNFVSSCPRPMLLTGVEGVAVAWNGLNVGGDSMSHRIEYPALGVKGDVFVRER